MPNCDHNCDNCAENCEERNVIPKLTPNKESHIKHIIGVVSGKGGVGKSFVTSLIASELNKRGYSVGILDGDITGPSIPKSFNIYEQATGDGHSYIFPALTKSGIKIISANLLLEREDEPIIWRGTLLSSLLRQFFTDVLWEELDYLLIDMPPGTGDITLTAFQQIPFEGIICVTTPQDLVSMVVSKALNMANKMNIKVLGLVENMSYLICPHCKEKINIYGESKIEELAKKFNTEVLAKLPLTLGDSTEVDKGNVELIHMKEMDELIDNLLKKEGELK
ncbi:MAG: Mrp/NBP35 family ATP-binding protein [Firmicutes bacterium]|uniref:Iron-sulfur cluster carrier protein n=1 Tax=Candidatus Onthovivens merdipullorum TaxID=2840889 RepID=A0A9D9GW10_9BACL|nr:Mrp/NBP35 family ATP-binding protein [Candidatus Onthovivens merdipullorum]